MMIIRRAGNKKVLEIKKKFKKYEEDANNKQEFLF